MTAHTPPNRTRIRTIRRAATGLAVAGLGTATALWACADSSCYPGWQLGAADYDCAGRAMISPGNDTRINLLMLMQSLGTAKAPAIAPRVDPEDPQFGRTFMTWPGLRAALWPESVPPAPNYDAPAPACEAAVPGTDDFLAALASAKGVSAAERATLTTLRETAGCHDGAWPDAQVTGKDARDFLAYLKAADAFHKGDYAAATQGFATLTRASAPWIAETAAYMPIRIGLRTAVANAVNEWGDFAGAEKVDKPAVTQARTAIDAYLKAFPKGRYAASAQGLKRRVAWLSGDITGLARTYEAMLAATPPTSPAAADLVEEIDRKLFEREDLGTVLTPQAGTPLLFAVADIKRMRPTGENAIGITAADLAAQKQAFASQPEIYGLLEASRVLAAGENARPVLALLPDAARQSSFTPLAFSRQMVRGQALATLRDPNEAGFWRELLGGAAPQYQRPLAELGLALRWQRDGRVEQVFAPGSPVTDQSIREILLQTLASPATLRASAADAARPGHERDVARFTLLHKDLTTGAYADFARDLALVPATANVDGGMWDFARQDSIPAGVFARGRWSDGFACPALVQTAATLARTPTDARARLCLGDFWRLNGFDDFALYAPGDGAMVLGKGTSQFPGRALSRDMIYTAIIADKAAAPDLRAYALYRAIRCYAPSGNNGCAGPARTYQDYEAQQAPQATRKAWFTELKQKYPNSQWAKSLKFYW